MFGKEIKAIRTTQQVTQNELSKATGLPQNTISWIESDKGIPNMYQGVLLANFFGITLDELIGRENPQNYKIDQRYNKGTINNNF